jgi:hypothetical protein
MTTAHVEKFAELVGVRRQNIWLRLRLRLAEFRPHLGVYSYLSFSGGAAYGELQRAEEASPSHHRTSYSGIEFHREHPSSLPCQSKASRRTNGTGTLLRRHQKAIKAGSVVYFRSAVYTEGSCVKCHTVGEWRGHHKPFRGLTSPRRIIRSSQVNLQRK